MIENNNTNDLELIPNWFFALNDFWFAVSLLKIALWGELGGRQILCGKLGRRQIAISVSMSSSMNAVVIVLEASKSGLATSPLRSDLLGRSPAPPRSLMPPQTKPTSPILPGL